MADRKVVAGVVAANGVLTLLIVGAELVLGVDHYRLVTDANALSGQPAYAGAQSYLAALTWAVGATVALFAASVLPPGGGHAGLRPLLLVGGAYMAAACLDDLYMLHESSKALGLTWQVAVLIHVGLFGAVLLAAWRRRRRTPWVVLVAAALALGLSQALDTAEAMGALGSVRGEQLIEESAKLMGISLLTAYMVLVARRALT